MKINIKHPTLEYDKGTKTFTTSGKLILFATSHTIVNTKTKNEVKFDFVESTGSEWDPKTLWIYKSDCGYTLRIKNDDVTPQHAENYLQAKLR